MLKKATIPWTANNLVKQIEKGALTFDNYVQRSLNWDDSRKSLLIHSMIEGYPIPPMFFAKSDNGYDAIDGKHRSTVIADFINNKFSLSDDVPPVVDEDGEELEISGYTFNSLPDWAKDNIKDYSLTIYYFDGINQEEIAEIFYRLNNGRPLKAIELMRVKAKSIEAFRAIADHDAIQMAVSDAGRRGYADELLSMQMWSILYSTNPSFVTKDFKVTIKDADVTTSQMNNIMNCLDKIVELYNEFDIETKEDKRMLRKLKARTHLVSLVYMANKIEDTELFIQMAKHFFGSTSKGASIDNSYNEAAGTGSAKAESIRKRIEALDKIM